MKVFMVSDYEWWAAPTAEDAVRDAIDNWQISEDEWQALYADDLHELTPEEMQGITFTDEDGTRRSFADELQRRLDDPAQKFPQFFAGCE